MDNLYMNYHDWQDVACTVRYTRYLVKNGHVKKWEHETAKFNTPKDAKEAVNNWNRIAMKMQEQHPENGLWIYVEEA